MGVPNDATQTIAVILDTNIVIALEDTGNDSHINNVAASTVYRLIHEVGGRILLLANQLHDFDRILDPTLKLCRQRQLNKYTLRSKVELDKSFLNAAGYPADTSAGSNDGVDASLLLTLQRGLATWLITEDRGIHKHAAKCGLEDRVLSISDALESLRALNGSETVQHYRAQFIEPHTIDLEDEIFVSLKGAYGEFPTWWKEKVVFEQRKCLVIGSETEIQGIAVFHKQDRSDLPSISMKICTFKIAEGHQGNKLGETLLEAALHYSRSEAASSCFVEVNRSQETLIRFLEEFGFYSLGSKESSPNEIAMGKILNPETDVNQPSNPLEYNRRYGPGRRRLSPAFMVPIIPRYHEMLFPSVSAQAPLFDTSYGNAIRKVYVCNSRTSRVREGDTLLFLRTRNAQAVYAVGVVEDTLRTAQPEALIAFCGSRSVYTAEDLKSFCQGEAFAMKFRLDQILSPGVSREELIGMGIMQESPRSISRVRSTEGTEWLMRILDDLP